MPTEETIVEVATVSEEESVAEQIEEQVEVEEEVSEEEVETEEEEEESSAEEVVEEEEEDHKKSANERIRELVERSKKAEKELQDLRSQFEAEQKQKEYLNKPFFELDMDRVEADIALTYERIDELKLEGKYSEAAREQKRIVDLLTAIEENDKVKAEWMQKQEVRKSEETKVQERLKSIDEAAAFYQKQKQIPDEVWQDAGVWLNEQFQKDAILGKKFADIVDKQGPIFAIEWAHTYTVENMGKAAEQTKQKKEEAKKKLVGGATQTGTVATPKTFDDLMKLSSDEIEKFERAQPKLFNQLINSKLKNS